MKTIQRWLFPLLIVAFTALICGLAISVVFPKEEGSLISTAKKQNSQQKELIHYTALGDSLTQGVGASLKGGFVPMVAQDLTDTYRLNGVEVDNFGKNGDRSDQILKRLQKNDEIQKSLAKADIITLTFGGNDLMKVIQQNIFGDLTVQTFDKPLVDYQDSVRALLKEVRKYNPSAPMYILGIYNPFYLYFPEITQMQSIVTNWNLGTEAVVKEEQRSYFIPINDLLYKGIDGSIGVEGEGDGTSASGTPDIKNNVIYEEDHFHPNNLGYQLMARAVKEELVKTKGEWLENGAVD